MMKFPRVFSALRAALIYALGASLWIIFMEGLLGAINAGPELHTRFAMLGGALYVLITTPLIYQYMTRDARAHAKLIAELRASEEKYRSFVEQLGEGVALVDETGRISEWNPTWERWSGRLRADVIGTPFWELLLHAGTG
jgi:PAS domain-containing protein